MVGAARGTGGREHVSACLRPPAPAPSPQARKPSRELLTCFLPEEVPVWDLSPWDGMEHTQDGYP